MLKAREIGPVGTALRVVTGLGLLYLAGAVEEGSWDVSWFDPWSDSSPCRESWLPSG
jgi:hypothetical protein